MTTFIVRLATVIVFALFAVLPAYAGNTGDAPLTDFTEASLLATRAPGPYLLPHATAPRSGRVVNTPADVPIVGAVYWYHFAERDGRLFAVGGNDEQPFTEHPVTTKGVDFRSEEWHYQQLREMGHAGLNLVLPLYWGNPGEKGRPRSHLRWSFEGVPPMVRALERLRRQGVAAPKIGLFYDTATLVANSAGHTVDLSTRDGRAWFYVSIRDFFSMVPPHLRATVRGRPLVMITPANYERANGVGDPRVLAYLRERFARDFGIEPYIVPHAVWNFPNADATLQGDGTNLSLQGGAATFAPGYDTPPLGPDEGGIYRAHAKGAYYRRQWERLLAADPAHRPRLVVIESWNQWVTGTAIAESKEWGRLFLKMTAPYAAMWKAGKRLKPKPNTAQPLAVTQAGLGFDPEPTGRGIQLVSPVGDGLWQRDTAAGSGCVSTLPGPPGTGEHLYFQVEDGFTYDLPDGAECELMVEYLDEGTTSFTVEYDASRGPGLFGAAYRPAGTIFRTGTGQWKAALLRLPDAWFVGRQNEGADFRIAISTEGPGLKVRWVTLRRLPAETGAAAGRPSP